MAEQYPFLTGWCSNGAIGNHHLCRHVYAHDEITRTCTCECHEVTQDTAG